LESQETWGFEDNLQRIKVFIDIVQKCIPSEANFFLDLEFFKVFKGMRARDFWSFRQPDLGLKFLLEKVLDVNRRLTLWDMTATSSATSKEPYPLVSFQHQLVGELLLEFPLDLWDSATVIPKLLQVLQQFDLLQEQNIVVGVTQLFSRTIALRPANFLAIFDALQTLFIDPLFKVRMPADFSGICAAALTFLQSSIGSDNISEWDWWQNSDPKPAFARLLTSMTKGLLTIGSGENGCLWDTLGHYLSTSISRLDARALWKADLTSKWWEELCESAFTSLGDKEILTRAAECSLHGNIFSSLLALLRKLPADEWWAGGAFDADAARLNEILLFIDSLRGRAKSDAARKLFIDVAFWETLFTQLDSADFWGGDAPISRFKTLLGTLNIQSRLSKFDVNETEAEQVTSWQNDLISGLLVAAPFDAWWAESLATLFDELLGVIDGFNLLTLPCIRMCLPLLGATTTGSTSLSLAKIKDAPIFILPRNATTEDQNVKQLLNPVPVLHLLHPELKFFELPLNEKHTKVGIVQLTRDDMLEKVCKVLRASKETSETAERQANLVAAESKQLAIVAQLNENNLRAQQSRNATLIDQLTVRNVALEDDNAQMRTQLAAQGQPVPPPLPAAVVQPQNPQPNFGAWVANQPHLLQAILGNAAAPVAAAGLGGGGGGGGVAGVGAGGGGAALNEQAAEEASAAALAVQMERLLRSCAIRRLRTRTTLCIVSRTAGTINLGFQTPWPSEIDDHIASFF
jgi:hypothetical protein